ncbi:MAG: hypothetical protein D3906_05455 [Candidatus Electrothrix sp. AUS1_2]|nr:hypothetical protein [Candidatus Electrothrix sp. AUS1_2]
MYPKNKTCSYISLQAHFSFFKWSFFANPEVIKEQVYRIIFISLFSEKEIYNEKTHHPRTAFSRSYICSHCCSVL